MNLYLQSEATVYDQLKADSVVRMPSSDTLAKKKQAQKTMVGDCAKMYEKWLHARKFTEDIGELICDEMKLKQDVVMNVNYNTVIDFIEDFINKKIISKNLLDDDKLDNICKLATQVCQWRARAVDRSSFNCRFWYNSHTLKGDKLLEQFNHVIIRCETISFQVLGFVYDAGGPNAWLMKLLRQKMELPEGDWMPIDAARTVNP